MAELIESYVVDGERHRIELVDGEGGGRLLLDREGCGAARIVAELGPEESREQALAVLYGEGAYLERVLGGDPAAVCGRLQEGEAPPAHLPRTIAALGQGAADGERAA